MRNSNPVILTGILVALFLSGCTSAPERALSRDVPPYTALANGYDPLNSDQLSPLFDRASTGIEEGVIAKHMTAKTLERVAAAYDDNRRLWVGTTNLDYDQTWVWNMTLIAKNGDLELYRKVLLASASFPIVFPPVEINGHLFGDGAARSNIVVTGLVGTKRPGLPRYGVGNIYVLENGRLRRPPIAMRDDIKSVAGEGIEALMNSSMEYVLVRSFVLAQSHGYNFNLVEIPADVDVGKNALAFNPKQMRAAFDAGLALGKQQYPWKHTPPNLGSTRPG